MTIYLVTVTDSNGLSDHTDNKTFDNRNDADAYAMELRAEYRHDRTRSVVVEEVEEA